MSNERKFEVIIGCEIHCQLLTNTKAFCACENRYGGMPNTRVCPVCLGLPGAMPRVSLGYVQMGAVAGIALNCKIAKFTKFDRKHYFYPDLVKGYQITQFDLPLCYDGFVDISPDRRIRIERIHLEEDVGKSLHLEGKNSYIDFNRSGTPLIEIVTKPDMRTPEEAALFMQTVQEILRYVEVTAGNLEEGNMRCDANVNLKIFDDGKEFRTPISEIKNLNSFKSIRDACSYEIQRQLKEFDDDRQLFEEGYKRTLGWDEAEGKTVLQRTKNSIVDYRFVVEPDIKPFTVSDRLVEEAANCVGELPEAKRTRLKKQFGLTDFDAQTLTSSKRLVEWFEDAAAKSKSPKKVANWILAEILAVLNEKNVSIDKIGFPPKDLADLVNLIEDGVITSKQAKDVFAEMLSSSKNPEKIVEEKNLAATSNTDEIRKVVMAVIEENPGPIAELKAGKTNVQGWLMGQVMKKSGGKANPTIAAQILADCLK